MNRRRASHSTAGPPPPPQMEALRVKLWRIISRHQQLKISFHHLNSQIATSLIEAEDVFASLATPLMKLVGLKTVEMADEGRFSTVVTAREPSHSQDEHYMSRAMTASNELVQRQKLQLMKLISHLRDIESQVNSSQNSILQNLTNHQAVIKNFFLKAYNYVSATHQSDQRNDLSLVMLKLLKTAFDLIGGALVSVEGGVDDLIHELDEKMCRPMVEYLNILKVEMNTGTCSRLLNIVEEMEGTMSVKKFELEEARKTARLAEIGRIEALSKLRATEETAGKMKANIEPKENEARQELFIKEQDPAKGDNLLWELLQKKRKSLMPESPVGPKELLGIGTYNKKRCSKSVIPSPSHRLMTRSQTKGLDSQTSVANSRMLLGSSPSASTRKHLSRKCITP